MSDSEDRLGKIRKGEAPYEPTEEEIAEETAKLRALWSSAQRKNRDLRPKSHWELPEYNLRDFMPDEPGLKDSI